MESDQYEDNRKIASRQSERSTEKYSPPPSVKKHKLREEKHEVDSRSKTRVYHSDPDRDLVSEEESKKSYYSDDYESPSERSLSSYSRSPSPTLQRQTKRVSSSPPYKTGTVGRRGARPQHGGRQYASQQLRKGARSRSKEPSPQKDLDLVTKRMLSARLLKINELHNALTELQQRTKDLQKENRILKQLQIRQEKALHRYDDTESEISQLIVRHSNEIHVLRERLRRTQERERAAERRLKDSEEQLQRSQATVTKLKKLVHQKDLGQRDELSRKLDEERGLRQEAERKIKELERSLELSTSSFHRQIVAEKKKTASSQEEARTQQEELERLTIKLKEKERELDAKNIYANRMLKLSQRKDAESGTRQKLLSRNCTVAVQTEDLRSSPDFPTPPPAITDANEYDEYLSLKELNKDPDIERRPNHEQTDKVKEKTLDHGQQQMPNVAEENIKPFKDVLKKELKGERAGQSDQKLEEKSPRCGHVQEEVQKWNQETLTNQQAAEEAQRKKEQLLAKMREIDQQNQAPSDNIFNEPNLTNHTSELKNSSTSIFSLTQPDNSTSLNTSRESREGFRRRTDKDSSVATSLGRRAFRTQISTDDLAFGNYAPSFGHMASRGISNFTPTPPKEDKMSALEAIGVFSVKKVDTEKEKETGGKDSKKSNLMEQLFGNLATSENINSSNNMGLFSSPPSINGVRSRREGLHSYNPGSSTPPAPNISTVHIAESRPAICAMASFDDDIEELTL